MWSDNPYVKLTDSCLKARRVSYPDIIMDGGFTGPRGNNKYFSGRTSYKLRCPARFECGQMEAAKLRSQTNAQSV